MRGIILLTLVPVLVLAQSEEDQIENILNDQVVAWNKGDIEGYMRGYWNSDETIFVSGGNVLAGYDSVLARYRRSYGTREKMGVLQFDDLNIRLISDRNAIATGRWQLNRKDDRPWGRFTLLLEKKPSGWRIVYDHTSSGSE